MIATNIYGNEGIELSDGTTICFPERDGRMKRIDKDGNTIEVRYLSNNKGQVWYELFDTHKDLIAEVKRLREQYAELREALVGDSPNWTHEELIEQALELSKPVELEFGEWHTDEGGDEE